MGKQGSFKRPAKGTPLSVEDAMNLAIEEAYLGAPYVSPNPLVGCVVLDETGHFLSCGHHEFYGGPHAEVNAVKGLSEADLQGAHVIVTLEPCAHEGKTPSCAKMLARLPIKRVTYGLTDPNPLVSGQGAQILRDADIEASEFSHSDVAVEMEMKEKLQEVCEAFLWNFRHKKVFVALKMASSVDGQVALRNGESQWITGPQSREHVHYLRACYDAILVGKGTIEFDNPSLNVRHPQIQKKNKVVVIDGEAELLPKLSQLKLVQAHSTDDIYWCVADDMKPQVQSWLRSSELQPQVLFVPTQVSGGLDLQALMAMLYQQGLRSVMVEGGAMTASSFVQEGLVNRIHLFMAPHLMGAGGSKSWTESLRIEKMSDRLLLYRPSYRIFGQDVMVTGRLN